MRHEISCPVIITHPFRPVLPASDASQTLGTSSVNHNSCVGEGGGIANLGGTLTLNDSSVTSNSCGFGGGIFNGGTLTLNDSIVSGNTPDNIVG